ncbi:aldehyde dehydrogenase family protein [Streptomyces calvus]|jgi:sulfoacetaldehyde dehydrogenase|uniref:aldehyde dehydrogenase family protein n=1 Tax=Streptomyces calvus TaxID=67282 RepID=UPI00371C6C1C
MITEAVDAAIHRARLAQQEAASWTQERVDEIVTAVGWQCYREENARRLALLSHSETSLGNPEHLYALQRRRVLGILRDLHGETTVGVVEDLPELGLRKLAKPLGVIAVATPATAPAPGIICNVLPMLKTRNAAVFSPNPRAAGTAGETIRIIRAALAEVGAPPDLVQCLETTGRAASSELMAAADYVVAIGGAGTVRRAYESGTPTIGAGVGNPTVVVDETADLTDASEKILTGASYNNGTSCSSESNVLVHASIADRFSAELVRRGAHLCTVEETARLRALLWPDGVALNREAIGRPASDLAELAGIPVEQPEKTALLVLAAEDPGKDDPVLREKIAPVLTLSVFDDFRQAVELVQLLADRCGRGHSCGIHSNRSDRVAELAEAVSTCRVVVNQSTMTNTGSFESGVPFTTTLSSGSWGGSSTSGNITWRHFLNYTLISRPIPARVPDEPTLFGKYWTERER